MQKNNKGIIINLILLVLVIALSIKVTAGFTGTGIPKTMKSNDKPASYSLQPVTDTFPDFPDTLIINNFETSNCINNLLDIEQNLLIEQSSEWSSENDQSARVEFEPQRYCELGMIYFPPWWDHYDSLSFDLFLEDGKLDAVTFRIGDSYSSSGYCAECQKFSVKLNIDSKQNYFSFAINDISNKIDINSQFKSIHFGFQPLTSGRFYLDNFRLTKNAEE